MITAPVLDMSPRAAPFHLPSTPTSSSAAKGGKHLILILILGIGGLLLIAVIISVVVIFSCKSNKEHKNEPAKETGMFLFTILSIPINVILLIYILALVLISFF